MTSLKNCLWALSKRVNMVMDMLVGKPWPTPSHLHWAPPSDMIKHPKSCKIPHFKMHETGKNSKMSKRLIMEIQPY
jgi:hypothetical protein